MQRQKKDNRTGDNQETKVQTRKNMPNEPKSQKHKTGTNGEGSKYTRGD